MGFWSSVLPGRDLCPLQLLGDLSGEGELSWLSLEECRGVSSLPRPLLPSPPLKPCRRRVGGDEDPTRHLGTSASTPLASAAAAWGESMGRSQGWRCHGLHVPEGSTVLPGAIVDSLHRAVGPYGDVFRPAAWTQGVKEAFRCQRQPGPSRLGPVTELFGCICVASENRTPRATAACM